MPRKIEKYSIIKACTGNVKKVNNIIFTNATNYDTICTIVNLSSVEDVKKRWLLRLIYCQRPDAVLIPAGFAIATLRHYMGGVLTTLGSVHLFLQPLEKG